MVVYIYIYYFWRATRARRYI